MEPKTACDRTIELLPWLLNASLEEPERREVEDHLRSCPACRAALVETRGAFELFGAHPPVEAIVALAADEAGAAAAFEVAGGRIGREALDAHLEHCAQCRDELELARESRRAIEGGADSSSARRSAAAVPGAVVPATVVPFARPERAEAVAARRFDWRPLALAASLLLAVIAAGGWLFSAEEATERQARIEELERQVPPAASEGTGAVGAVEGSGESGKIAELERRLAEIGRSVEEARATADAAERQLAGLAETNERLERALAGSPQVVQLATPVVQRGGPGEPMEISRGAGRAVVAIYTDLAEIELTGGRLSYRLQGPGGRTLATGGPLARLRDPMGGEYVSLTLATAELPTGTATMTLLEDGREVGSFPLRVVR